MKGESQPPKWATRLLHWFCASHLVNDLEGDLLELFAQRVRKHGLRQARQRYVRDVFSLMRPFAFKKEPERYPKPVFSPPAMIRNYLKIAFRNLAKHKMFSFINVMGLSAGMTACFLIALYVHFELTYDAFNKKADRIYRVATDVQTNSETLRYSISPWAMASNMQNDFPEMEACARVRKEEMLFRKGDLKFVEENAVLADSTLFEVFDFKLLNGNPKTALMTPLSIVLTETSAQKYFGNKDPMGQTLLWGDQGELVTVTGVMQDPPVNSQIKGDMFVSMSTYTAHRDKNIEQEWGSFGATAFVLLKPGTDPATMEKKFPAFLQNHAGKMMAEQQMQIRMLLEPLRDIYLHSTRPADESGNINNVYVFSAVALFIMLIACINFVNLTTARSVERAREVGVRKAVGAARSTLARQFLAESIMMCVIAFLISVILSAALIPLFNELAGKSVSKGIIAELPFVAILLVAALLIGLLAGIYPAFVLSSFEPVKVLKGRFTTSAKGVMLRKGLVTVQFTISITMIIATIVVYTQLDFMRSHDLGFSKNQTLVIQSGVGRERDVFEASIMDLAGVRSATASAAVPGGLNPQAFSKLENKRGEMQAANLDVYRVDFDFITQYGLKIVAGRSFSKKFATDSTRALVINEAAAKMLGYATPGEAVGKQFDQWDRQGTIIGVVKNFHFKSLQENIKPLTFRLIDFWNGKLLSVQVDGKNVKQTLSAIENKWRTMHPDQPFSYYFLDEFYDRQYRADERFEALFLNFAVLAIFISCLGLLGLASYSTVQRTKEIGVRKVMGASAASIVTLLSGDFLQLIGIAFIIAAPLAWFAMDRWLDSFAYKTDIHLWTFIVAALLSALVALLTISFQSIRAALINPVKSLRSE
ncbi:permease prefix domain 2-containing transporter [Dyadobacter chenwenxiniae]|uniref:Permease prefix domain 2-containing transporter n=1 Tax=Dyadobacter chenwenxiniae TaxID=2906456 RepID=A0A9X1TNH9_9BACT|nr:ABC transporter permease [Dyadobacter chenwenxiniae]MCF0064573.1 permease prefix domain 2-containing transporter [Dyadobacter chenwenxiniae]UON84369.1 permease prefix domain 2-containing transporter [Dyadobacter chenwenxiniae]